MAIWRPPPVRYHPGSPPAGARSTRAAWARNRSSSTRATGPRGRRIPVRCARSNHGTARHWPQREWSLSTGRRAVVGKNARGSRRIASTAEGLCHLSQHVGEQVVTACKLVGQTTRALYVSAGERFDQSLRVVTVQREATLRIIDDRPRRDDELPVGRLRDRKSVV